MSLWNGLGSSVRSDVSLAELTSFRCGGTARFFTSPETTDNLISVAVRCAENGIEKKKMDSDVFSIFSRYDWPGNIRELENEIYRLVALSDDMITADLVSSHIQKPDVKLEDLAPKIERINAETLKKAVAKVERQVIAAALKKTGGNQTKAAKLLGLSRFGLRKKMQRWLHEWMKQTRDPLLPAFECRYSSEKRKSALADMYGENYLKAGKKKR